MKKNKKPKRILVPLNDLWVTPELLVEIEKLACQNEAEVLLLRVLIKEDGSAALQPDEWADAWQMAQEDLIRIEADLVSLGIQATSMIHEAQVRPVLRDIAREEHVDFIAVASNEHRFGIGTKTRTTVKRGLRRKSKSLRLQLLRHQT